MADPPSHLNDADEVLGSVEVDEETFWLSRDRGMIYAGHEGSSIVGMGKTREEAWQDARYSAHILYLEGVDEDEPMTEGLKDLLPFARSFAEDPYDDGGCQCSMCRWERGEFQ